jgi:hypothetical protein
MQHLLLAKAAASALTLKRGLPVVFPRKQGQLKMTNRDDQEKRRDEVALDALYERKDKLFVGIEKLFAAQLGFDFESLSADKKDEISDEAQELTENWDAADLEKGQLEASTEMQKLLKEHHEICELILDLRDRDIEDDDLLE